MKITVAIILLGLVSSTLAFYNVRRLPSTVIDTSFLKDVNTPKKHTFKGLTTLMQQLRDTSQVEEYLDGLLDGIAQGREERLAIIQKTRQDCSDEKAFREEAVAEGQRAAAAAEAQLNLCNAQREQAVHLGELAANALAVYEQNLADLEATREEEVSTYNSRVAKLQNAQQVIQQIRDYLTEIEIEANAPLGSEFVQITNKLLKHSVSTGHSHHVLPVYTKLIQMQIKQSVNEDDIQGVQDALDVLDQRAAQSLQNLADQEAQDEADYNNEKARLEDLIQRLSNQVAVTNQFEATMDQCIAQESSLLALSNDKVSRNTDLLNTSEQLCSAAEDEWRVYELDRTSQVSLVNSLKQAINDLEVEYEQQEGPQVGDIINVKML